MTDTLLVPGVWGRLLHEDDVAALTRAYVRNRRHLAPWEPARTDAFFTEAGQRTETARKLTEHRQGLALPLVLTDGDEICGTLNITSISRGAFQSALVGYWIDERQQRRGIASAAVSWAARIARDELGLHRLQAGALLHNAGSRRVLERAGFTEIGVAPRYLQINGRWQDHMLYQLLLE